MSDAYEGVFSALVTPMTPDEEVDLNKLAEFADYLIEEGGVHGLAPLGSTGEYYALSEDERDDVARVTIEAAAGRVPVFVGANAGSTRDVARYCRRAESLGASGVLLAAPYYSLPTPGELFAHFRAVNNVIGIPIMLYNYPGRTGVDMTPELVASLAELDHVCYVKESTGDATRVTEIIRRCGEKIRVFCGCDTLALESLFSGAVGWVGGVVNVLPKEHVRLFELAFQEANVLGARELYYRLLPTLALMEGRGKYTQFVKAGCQLTAQPVGPPRQPLRAALPEEVAELAGSLQTLQGHGVC